MAQSLNSKRLFEEAKRYVPGGVHSPVRAFRAVDGSPLFIKSGRGCKIVCEDDRTYLDFCGSWGPLIHGHADPDIEKAIITAVKKGCTFGAPTALANQLARMIVDHHRFIDMVRFVSSGTEAVMSAVRLARGYTAKNKIIKFEGCYHGHVDSMLVKSGSGMATSGVSISEGIPDSYIGETLVLPLGDHEALDRCIANNNDIAAVIIEPIPANHGLLLQPEKFLQHLRDQCTRNSIVLIFDEVISGFRVGFEGAAGLYNIDPDLLTLGKIIGGGMPVGAFAGKEKIMKRISPEGNVYQAGTLSANPVAMAAGIASLKKLLEGNFYSSLEEKTQFFTDLIIRHIDRHKYPVKIVTCGSIFWISFSNKKIHRAREIDRESDRYFAVLHRHCLDRGVYLGPSAYEVGFVSSAHGKGDLDKGAKIINSGLDRIFATHHD